MASIKRICSTVVAAIAVAAVSSSAFALRPGQEAKTAGCSSNMATGEVVNAKAGEFTYQVKGLFLVYMSKPTGVKTNGGPCEDDSHKSHDVWHAALADNPSITGDVCYTGVGGDWKDKACAPLQGSTAAVRLTYPVKETKLPATVVIVPRLYQGGRPYMAWLSHASNSSHLLHCPELEAVDPNERDMGTVLRINADYSVRVVSGPQTGKMTAEDGRIIDEYQPFYNTFCGRLRDVKNVSPDQ